MHTFRLTLTILLLSLTAGIHAQQDLVLHAFIQQNEPDEPSVLELRTEEDWSLIAVQFALTVNENAYAFGEIIDTGDLGGDVANSISSPADTAVFMAWISPDAAPVDLPANSLIYAVELEQLGAAPLNLQIDETALVSEIVNGDGEVSNAVLGGITYSGFAGAVVSGNVFHDTDADCIMQETEQALGGIKIDFTSENNSFSRFTDAAGAYTVLLNEEEYTISIATEEESGLWGNCAPQTLTVTAGEDAQINLGRTAQTDCAAMSVEIASALLIRCFDSFYQVNWCNTGTLPVENAEIAVEPDEDLLYLDSSLPLAGQSDNVLFFNLSEVPVGACGTFRIDVEVGCDSVLLGETHCTRAIITPQNDCQEIDPLWDGSDLLVSGVCTDEEVVFTLTNQGGDMTQPTDVLFIRNDTIIQEESVQLTTGESTEYAAVANGATYRLIAAQVAGHPRTSDPTAAIEGCGGEEVALGYITDFPEYDGADYIAISCSENVGSYDPNDKTAYPRGAGEDFLLAENTDIDYHIRFQNTGTFTAFNVVIRDTLSEFLDVSQIRPGASSHDYVLNIYEGNILEFRFDDINLPDSMSNLTGSNGFVKFGIAQQPDLPTGTVIENMAAIYFDFNEPVFTNTAFHTIGRELVIMTNIEKATAAPIRVNVSPNPTQERALFTLENLSLQDGTFLLYDATGHRVRQSDFTGNSFLFIRSGLSDGLYFYEISEGGISVATGKVVFE